MTDVLNELLFKAEKLKLHSKTTGVGATDRREEYKKLSEFYGTALELRELLVRRQNAIVDCQVMVHLKPDNACHFAFLNAY